jgi:hypothetical protein
VQGGLDAYGRIQRSVAAGSLSGSTWGSAFDSYQSIAVEFLSAVRERTILGRMASGLRRVPLNVQVALQGAPSSAGWVGEGKPKPLTTGVSSGPTVLQPLKIVAQVVLTQALLRHASPDAESLVREDLIAAVAKAMDQSFIDPQNAGVSDVEPASVLNGATAITSSGTYDDDLVALIDSFEGDLSRAFFVSRPEVFTRISSASNPFCGARGGELKLIPCIASRHVPDDVLGIVDAGGVAYGEGVLEVALSGQTTIEMETAHTQNALTGTGAATVSMFQTNSVAIRAEMYANWQARSDAVAYLTAITSSAGA